MISPLANSGEQERKHYSICSVVLAKLSFFSSRDPSIKKFRVSLRNQTIFSGAGFMNNFFSQLQSPKDQCAHRSPLDIDSWTNSLNKFVVPLVNTMKILEQNGGKKGWHTRWYFWEKISLNSPISTRARTCTAILISLLPLLLMKDRQYYKV